MEKIVLSKEELDNLTQLQNEQNEFVFKVFPDNNSSPILTMETFIRYN